jgi:hypothetical protein
MPIHTDFPYTLDRTTSIGSNAEQPQKLFKKWHFQLHLASALVLSNQRQIAHGEITTSNVQKSASLFRIV